MDHKNLTSAFPDYDHATLPAIPAGWVDTSWRNDSCPSFEVDGLDDIQIFVDFEKIEDREIQEGTRYAILHINDTVDTLLATDDWDEVLAFIIQLQKDNK